MCSFGELVTAVAMLTTTAPPAFSDDPSLALGMAPDSAMQERLGAVVSVVIDTDVPQSEKMRAVGTLRTVAKDDEGFFRELFYYYVQNAHSNEEAERRQLAVLRLVDMLHVSPFAVAETTVPYLDSENATLVRIAQSFLRSVESLPVSGIKNYSYYYPFLRPEPVLPLVRRMYRQAPGTALITLAKTYEVPHCRFRRVIWAEHVIANAIWERQHGFVVKEPVHAEAVAEAGKLSQDGTWWVRLYVAEILRQHPQFRRPEIVARLVDDEHTLVRETMQFARETPKP